MLPPWWQNVARPRARQIEVTSGARQIKECAAEELGKGYLVSCLVDHRGNISDYQCKQYITKMTGIVFSDYRLICGFTDSCRDDINTLHCGSINSGDKVRRRHSETCPNRCPATYTWGLNVFVKKKKNY